MRKSRARGRQPAEFDPQSPPEVPGVTDLTLIGGGGSASVYKGHEAAHGRPVAVKVLHARLRDAKERAGFEGECRRAGEAGEHPYAANVYRSGFTDEDWPYLVMRYYARGSLAGALRAASGQPLGDTLATCANVACALQYAHNLSIVHRDVKPENILVDAYGDPALADFGISTDLDAATRTLRPAMTPAYAAPEVLQHGGGWPYSDVWSLAATLYALLSGRPPFYDHQRPDPRANLQALAGPLPPLGRPDVPGHVAGTLSRALIGRHDDRTVSAQRFAEELNENLELLGATPVPIRIEPPGHETSRGAPMAPPRRPATVSPPVQLSAPPRQPRQPQPPPRHPVEYPQARYPTGTGQPTTYLTHGGFAAPPGGGPTGGHGRAAVPGEGSGWEPPAHGTGYATQHGSTTGYIDTGHYRMPLPEPKGTQPRRRLRPGLALAGGGAAAAVLLVVAYLVAGPKQPAAPKAGPSASGTDPAGGTAAVPSPQHVTAVLASSTSVRLSWTNSGAHAADHQVIVSMGSGYQTRAVANHSPQVITGLTAAQPYCFAVGYYIASGRVAYSTVTASACVNGGAPAAG
jgi:serine/threonine protein kinase